MSQRLHIGKTDKETYDCVLEDEINARGKLINDWLCITRFFYAGPWKIFIGDYELWTKVEPVVSKIFDQLGEKYPDCISSFKIGERTIVCPTREELDRFFSEA